MMAEYYKITTINVRGLAEDKKRTSLFKEWEEKYNIVFSNETHCSELKESDWDNQTTFETSWSNKSSRAGGCALFTKDLKQNVIFKSNDGRIIIANVDLPKIGEVCLVCVYAPTQDHRKEQLNFLNVLKQKLEPVTLPILLGGDINVCLSSRDKKGGADLKFNAYRNELIKFLEYKGLCDVFRALNFEKEAYTWRDRCRGGQIVQERLDYLFCSESLFHLWRKCSIRPCSVSDHSYVELESHKLKDMERGKSTWKLNLSLLKDKKYIDMVNKILDEKHRWESDDKGLQLEILKALIRGESISFSKRKKTELNLLQLP